MGTDQVEKEKSPAPEKPAGQGGDAQGKTGSEEKSFGRTESTPKDTAANRTNRAEQHEMIKAVGSYFGSAQIGQIVVNQGTGVQYSSTLGSPAVSYDEITQDDLDRIVYVYEMPKGYIDAQKQLASKHIVILQGPVHVGKRAMGIKLAVDTLGEGVRIEVLAADTNLLERLKPEYIHANTAYLVDGFVASRAEKLTEHDWNSLGQKLSIQSAYLVACVTSDAKLGSYANSNLCHSVKLPNVEVSRLVEKHVEYFLRDSDEPVSPEAIRQCLANEQVRSLIKDRIEPESVVNLAGLLAQFLKGDCQLEEIIEKYSSRSEKIVQEWFEECGDDLDERAYRIALAVLDGARVSSIDDAAAALTKLLKPEPKPDPEKPEEQPPPPSPFARPRKPRLERSRAHIETIYVPTEYSDNAEVKVVKLNDQYYQYALIKYLWEEYGDFQENFLKWLSNLAVMYNADIRERAAAAVGALASIDFESIRIRVLVDWAFRDDENRDLKRRYRKALSTAFLTLIWDDRHAADVLGLLRYWSEYKDRDLVWAAARAYSAVGLRYPQEAMEVWRSIVDSAEGELTIDHDTMVIHGDGMLISLINAIEYLYTSAFEWPEQFNMVYEQILEALKNWIQLDAEPKSKSHLGLPLLLILMNVPMPTDDESSQASTKPPALLAMFNTNDPNPHALDNLVWLLRKVLNDQFYRQAALRIIHAWLSFVDEDNNLLRTSKVVFNAFLAKSDLRPREVERLKIYFERWANHPEEDKKSKTAQTLLNELNWSGTKLLTT